MILYHAHAEVAKEALERCVYVDKMQKEVEFNYCFIVNDGVESPCETELTSITELDSDGSLDAERYMVYAC